MTQEELKQLIETNETSRVEFTRSVTDTDKFREAICSSENFPRVNSYRNPILAEVLHNLGYVNRFGRGVVKAKSLLLENGSAGPTFQFEPNHFLATIPKHPDR